MKKQPTRITAYDWFCLATSMILVCLGLYSCSPAKRLARLSIIHPDVAASVFSRLYPIHSIDSNSVEHRPGAVMFIRDTVTIECPPAGADHPAARILRVPCPPVAHRTDTVIISKFKQIQDPGVIAE